MVKNAGFVEFSSRSSLEVPTGILISPTFYIIPNFLFNSNIIPILEFVIFFNTDSSREKEFFVRKIFLLVEGDFRCTFLVSFFFSFFWPHLVITLVKSVKKGTHIYEYFGYFYPSVAQMLQAK